MNNESMSKVEKESEIDLADLFGILKKYFILLIAVALVAAILVYGYCSIFVKPTYSANAKIYIVSKMGSTIQISDFTLGKNVASDYIDLMKDRVILEKVIEALQLPYSVNKLSGMISVTNSNDTHMLVITVKSNSPTEAADIANALADVTINYVPTILETQAPNIVHRAIPNNSKIAPHNTRNALIGAVIAAVVCYAALFLRFFLDDSIRSSEDISHFVGLHILGEISDTHEGKKGYGKYGKYGKYGSKYGQYGKYGSYGVTAQANGNESSDKGGTNG